MPESADLEIGKKYSGWTIIEDTGRQTRWGEKIYKARAHNGKEKEMWHSWIIYGGGHSESDDPLDKSDIIPFNTFFNKLLYAGLNEVMKSLNKELMSEYKFAQSDLAHEILFTSYDFPFSFWVENEMIMNLYTCYKQNEIPLTGSNQLERRIRIIFKKLASFIFGRVSEFERNLSKLEKAFEREKKKTKKLKIVTQPTEPIRIPLDIRFAIIKRASDKCEDCGSSILDSPIDVYQIYESENKDIIKFIAYCENCRNRNIDRIIPEP